jgi:FKBP-type peptidyl-prolyl cis-trans isomerase
LKDGTVFDQSAKPVDYRIGSTIPGLSTGLQLLGTGGKAVFYLPPSLGYGSRKVMGIPPDSGLIFEVEVLAVNRQKEAGGTRYALGDGC